MEEVMGRILDLGLGGGQRGWGKPPVPNLRLNRGAVSPEIIGRDTQKGGRGEAGNKAQRNGS